jgi:hypothetical protein
MPTRYLEFPIILFIKIHSKGFYFGRDLSLKKNMALVFGDPSKNEVDNSLYIITRFKLALILEKMNKIKYLILFLTINCYSQNVIVKGIALDSSKESNNVVIIINDTLNKLLKLENGFVSYEEQYENKKLRKETNKDGSFEFKAKKTDSLYFSSWRHITKSFSVNDLYKTKNLKIILDSEVCEEYIKCEEKKPQLFVFIGEKIKVSYAKRKYYCNIISMDSQFDAEYKIVENVFGNFENDTIKFSAYDHYGKPAFGEFKYVLLYVGKYCDKLIHIKYQFAEVYRTKNNRWATPYQSDDYKRIKDKETFIPEIIDFAEPVKYDIKGNSQESIERRFPKPYYEIKNDKAIAVYGNYVEDAFEIKKEAVLKSYDFFK